MKSCAICGSHAFNMALEGVNQGAFCDRHYWQRKAESLEVARAASPKVPHGVEEWIEQHAFETESNGWSSNKCVVSVASLRAYLSGMALVPVEPTDEMVDAMAEAHNSKGANLSGIRMQKRDEYVAAILAATKEKGE